MTSPPPHLMWVAWREDSGLTVPRSLNQRGPLEEGPWRRASVWPTFPALRTTHYAWLCEPPCPLLGWGSIFSLFHSSLFYSTTFPCVYIGMLFNISYTDMRTCIPYMFTSCLQRPVSHCDHLSSLSFRHKYSLNVCWIIVSSSDCKINAILFLKIVKCIETDFYGDRFVG